MRTLLHRRLGQPDEYQFRQAGGRDIDFHFDRQGVDPDEREGLEFGEHGSPISAATRKAGVNVSTNNEEKKSTAFDPHIVAVFDRHCKGLTAEASQGVSPRVSCKARPQPIAS
jgi:hypothetical protein